MWAPRNKPRPRQAKVFTHWALSPALLMFDRWFTVLYRKTIDRLLPIAYSVIWLNCLALMGFQSIPESLHKMPPLPAYSFPL